MNFLGLGFILIEEYKFFFKNSGRGGARRGRAVWGRGGVGCPDHRGGAGLGHMFIGRGGFGSPMIRSRSAPLPSLDYIHDHIFIIMLQNIRTGPLKFKCSFLLNKKGGNYDHSSYFKNA
jgi:hypothetical protein